MNINGAQYEDENPYQLLRDSDDQPGYFPKCATYKSSVDFKVKSDYDFYIDNVSSDFEQIKRLIFEEGPILAMIDSKFYIL